MSPFERHRDKILGHYSTASWLRKIVMALWNGSGHPVGLSNLTNLDAEHFRAFQEMVEHYHRHGENDQAFMRLALECKARGEEEEAARVRAGRFETWDQDAKYELRVLGLDSGATDDYFNWFEAQFDAGATPAAAAGAWKARSHTASTQ